MVITCLHDRRADQWHSPLRSLILLLALSRFSSMVGHRGRGATGVHIFYGRLSASSSGFSSSSTRSHMVPRSSPRSSASDERAASQPHHVHQCACGLPHGRRARRSAREARDGHLAHRAHQRAALRPLSMRSEHVSSGHNAAEEMLQRGLVSLLLAPLLGCVWGWSQGAGWTRREKLNELESRLPRRLLRRTSSTGCAIMRSSSRRRESNRCCVRWPAPARRHLGRPRAEEASHANAMQRVSMASRRADSTGPPP